MSRVERTTQADLVKRLEQRYVNSVKSAVGITVETHEACDHFENTVDAAASMARSGTGKAP
jgi:hypothetical protein